MKKLPTIAALPLVLAAPLAAQDVEPEYITPGSVIANAAAEEWMAIPAEDLLLMKLAPDAAGNPRTVVIQLIPDPLSRPWVANIRTLARRNWWDGTSVNRVQDNYVTQWGGVTEERPLPARIRAPDVSYSISRDGHPRTAWCRHHVCPPHPVFDELSTPIEDAFGTSGFWSGWPLARDGRFTWPIHCYGYVGVGRDYAPDTGTGAELYTIIGQPQRHMDRNLAVVGRVIEGMEHLSSLPRGSGDLGFYIDDEAHLRVPIVSVRLASEIENAPAFEYLSTSSESFARYVQVRANRNDAFYRVPAGGVDVCSVQVPVRRIAS